jgi:hypothetical protein
MGGRVETLAVSLRSTIGKPCLFVTRALRGNARFRPSTTEPTVGWLKIRIDAGLKSELGSSWNLRFPGTKSWASIAGMIIQMAPLTKREWTWSLARSIENTLRLSPDFSAIFTPTGPGAQAAALVSCSRPSLKKDCRSRWPRLTSPNRSSSLGECRLVQHHIHQTQSVVAELVLFGPDKMALVVAILADPCFLEPPFRFAGPCSPYSRRGGRRQRR